MDRKARLHNVIFALLLLPAPLFGQEASDRWRVDLEMGLNGASGNSSFSILRTGAKVTLLDNNALEFVTSGLVRYGKNDEKVIADDAKASMKLDLWPKDTWSPFFFTDWSRDKIRKLDTRISGGAGGKWAFWSGPRGRASVSGALLFDYQNFQVPPGSTQAASERHGRWSVLTKLQRRLSDGATFEHVMTFQPVVSRASDYVLDITHSVTTQLMGSLSLSVEHEYLRDSVPPPGAGPDDQKFSVLLKMSF